MRESQGESSGIRYFNYYETAWFDQLRLIEMDRLWMKCVGFQVMNWTRKSSLHVKLLRVLLWCFAFAVFHFLASSAFLTFPTLAIERMLEKLWSAMVSLARQQFLAVAKNEVFCCYILWKECEQERLSSKKKSISEKKFTESEQYKDAERFKINCQLGESTFINLLLHFIFA